ncbi:hypothetical protein EXIGLDRAFT_105846 [Exidia glandulosa HHB12029]|uniref:Uncharacterized protein n=1 Tax=Exidia glandulosa HHB12029 TaxID=1314781 RepID=A0A165GU91_EXIGL|nr:hypothetical protein EXIGLDRAFT_105846 [Exidia glandulosa HHB12029]
MCTLVARKERRAACSVRASDLGFDAHPSAGRAHLWKAHRLSRRSRISFAEHLLIALELGLCAHGQHEACHQWQRSVTNISATPSVQTARSQALRSKPFVRACCVRECTGNPLCALLDRYSGNLDSLASESLSPPLYTLSSRRLLHATHGLVLIDRFASTQGHDSCAVGSLRRPSGPRQRSH